MTAVANRSGDGCTEGVSIHRWGTSADARSGWYASGSTYEAAKGRQGHGQAKVE